MKIGVGKILLGVVAVGLVAWCAAQFSHQRRFGHLVGYGPHTDVIIGNSDIGARDMHYARLFNFSLMPFSLEGCNFANDVIGVPDSVLPRWDIQKPDSAPGRWLSLHGADKWVPGPFGGYWKEEPCHAATLRLAPFQSWDVAWVYKDWVTTGEPVRMAIHTSVSKAPDSQMIVYTDFFTVTPARDQRPEQR